MLPGILALQYIRLLLVFSNAAHKTVLIYFGALNKRVAPSFLPIFALTSSSIGYKSAWPLYHAFNSFFAKLYKSFVFFQET